MKGKTHSKSRKAIRRKRARQQLRLRRAISVLMLLLSLLFGLLAAKAAPSLTLVIWGLAALVLMALAALLAKKRPAKLSVYALLGLVCAALIVAGAGSGRIVYHEGRFVPEETLVTQLRVTDAWPANIGAMQNLEALDMTDSTVSDFGPILSLSSLRQLDVRGNAAFTHETHDMLAAAMPELDIRWSIPMGDAWVDSEAEVADLTQADTTPGELRELFDEYGGDYDFDYEVSLLGKRYHTDVTALDLRDTADIDTDAINDALTMLTAVETVDLRGTPVSAEVIAALCDANPDIRFMFTCDVPYGGMTTEDAEAVAGGGYDDLLTYMSFIDYMPNLTQMDARGIQLTDEQIAAIQADARSRKLVYSFTAFGRSVSTLDTELNLDDVPISSVEDVERCLSAMPNLTRVSMCNCGLSDQDMGGICDRHPDVKFIWWVHFGKYTLRTDATAFTTNLYASNKYGYTSGTFWPLQYCTDLMMLDIGHCKLTSIDAIARMKKLRVLILADNKISDISALAELEDLEYVEVFLNNISDLSPLANKTRLLDLNLYYNPLGDVTPICSCTSLERLWIGKSGVSDSQLSKLRKALPNCKINTRGSASTGNGWRDHRRYKVIKQMYKTGQYIPFS